jgi:hypothetical protein
MKWVADNKTAIIAGSLVLNKAAEQSYLLGGDAPYP